MSQSIIVEGRIEDSYLMIKFKLYCCVLRELRVLVFCTRDLTIVRKISFGIRMRDVNHDELYRTDGANGVFVVKRGRDSLKWCPSWSVTLNYVQMFPISAGHAHWHSSSLRNTDLSWIGRCAVPTRSVESEQITTLWKNTRRGSDSPEDPIWDTQRDESTTLRHDRFHRAIVIFEYDDENSCLERCPPYKIWLRSTSW